MKINAQIGLAFLDRLREVEDPWETASQLRELINAYQSSGREEKGLSHGNHFSFAYLCDLWWRKEKRTRNGQTGKVKQRDESLMIKQANSKNDFRKP